MKVDPKLESIANKVVSNMNSKPSDEHGSIILILMVISITLSLIRVIQECNKTKLFGLNKKEQCKTLNQEIKTLAIKRTWLNQLRLNRIIKNQLSKEDYKAYGSSLKTAIMDVGSNLTEEESKVLLEAANV